MPLSQSPAPRLSISVVLPTLNTMEWLPGHVSDMRQWLDLVTEVIVVDSESNDGTIEYLRQNLEHENVRYFSRPQGLYQAWNYGIQQARASYVYISTVGDSMSRDGLVHLHDVAESMSADVLISLPRFIGSTGQPVEPLSWPAGRLVNMLNLTEPQRLNPWSAFGMAYISIAQSILGSSASNLYRAAYLQANPFPCEYGIAGDTAWGIANALHARVVITPQVFSEFRLHEKSYDVSAYRVEDLLVKLDFLAELAFDRVMSENTVLVGMPEATIVAALIESRRTARDHQARLSAIRRSGELWILSPAAWRARLGRNRARRNFQRLALLLLTHGTTLRRARAAVQQGGWLRRTILR